MNNTESVDVFNPVKIYPDGSMWCALWGEDLQSGLCGFGRSPDLALTELIKQPEFWEKTPHGVWDLTCSDCGHHAVHTMPFPFEYDDIICHVCGNRIPVSSEPKSLG